MAMTPLEPRLPRFTGWLRPVVDAVARRDASVHRKLLSGFLAGALLLVGMAVLSLVVIGRMNERVSDLDRLQDKASRAQQMLYAVTAQSHYRAMALLTGDDKYNGQIADCQADVRRPARRDGAGRPRRRRLLRGRPDRQRAYAASSARALALYEAGDIAGATRLHLEEEHPASHVLEAAMRTLIADGRASRWSRRRRPSTPTASCSRHVVGFSAVSVVVALLLGFVLSWAFILPVRKMQRALAGITARRLHASESRCPNRDEFGSSPATSTTRASASRTLFEEQRALARRLERDERLARTRERGEVASSWPA